MAIGCTNDESFYEQSEIDDNGVVVLQERNAALPKEIRTRPVILEDKTATRAVNESGGIIGNSDVLLGYSYSIGNSILGDYENVISPVIDLMKVKEYGSDRCICQNAFLILIIIVMSQSYRKLKKWLLDSNLIWAYLN